MTIEKACSEERIQPDTFETLEDFIIYLKHVFAYDAAVQLIPSESHVLEVGCGEGYGTNILAEHVQKIVGLDVDPSIIQHASEKYAFNNIFFKPYDGITIPYGNESFDAVVSFQVIEHIQDDRNYISEIHRVLKNHGSLYLTTPNRSQRLVQGQNLWNRYHIREYSQIELQKTLLSCFQNVDIWAVDATDSIHEIEKQRQMRIRRIIALDPLNLRKRLPEKIYNRLKEIMKRFYRSDQKKSIERNLFSQYSGKDFYLNKEQIEHGFDLFAVCRK